MNEKDAISSALLSRTQDTHSEVVELLYGSNIAIPMLIKDPNVLVSNIIQALGTTNPNVEVKPKKGLVKLHLGFIVSHLLLGSAEAEDNDEVGTKTKTKRMVDVTENVFWGLIFPFLEFTKPRQHTAELVWEVVKELEGRKGLESLGPFELIKGCVKVVEAVREEAGSDQVERMVAINGCMVKLIAGQFGFNMGCIEGKVDCFFREYVEVE